MYCFLLMLYVCYSFDITILKTLIFWKITERCCSFKTFLHNNFDAWNFLLSSLFLNNLFYCSVKICLSVGLSVQRTAMIIQCKSSCLRYEFWLVCYDWPHPVVKVNIIRISFAFEHCVFDIICRTRNYIEWYNVISYTRIWIIRLLNAMHQQWNR